MTARAWLIPSKWEGLLPVCNRKRLPPAPPRIAGKRCGGIEHGYMDVSRIAALHAFLGSPADFEQLRLRILDTPIPLQGEVTPPEVRMAAGRAGAGAVERSACK